MGCITSCFGREENSEPTILDKPQYIQKMVPQKTMEAKIVLMGTTGVGKSSIALRYVHEKFSDSHEVTIGGAYLQKQLTLHNGTNVKMHIWDTGGADRFRNMSHFYYKDADAIILVFDGTQEQSLSTVIDWIEQLNMDLDMRKISLAIAANKADLTQDKGSIDKGKKIAFSNNAIFKQTSAKTGEGVNELFLQLLERAMCSRV